MGKVRKVRKSDTRNPKSKKRATQYKVAADDDMMDDEIDAFHKQRDIVPLDINDDVGVSDEDDEHPVFDLKDASDDEEDDEDEDIEDDTLLTGLGAKMARQHKFMLGKVGGVEDEMHDDVEEEEEKRAVWGRHKNSYYGDEKVQSSDDEQPAEEEAEAVRMWKEKQKSLSIEDYALEDVCQDESDGEPTLEEILVKRKVASKASADKEAQDDPDSAYEEVKKDLNALSKEEQMDVVYSSAPELVGLLSELNDALEELENKVNPLLSKVKEGGNTMKGGMHYMEVKQLLLLAYCQAITFYLLLKSEGQPVRDHPVIARLVEIKNLLDKIKQLDANLPSELEDVLRKKDFTETVVNSLQDDIAMPSDSFINHHKLAVGKQEATVVKLKPREAVQVVKVNSSKVDESKVRKRKHLNDHIGVQSMEMLKVRAALEEKLKQKGIFGSIAPKRDGIQKRLQPLNGQLETLDDFDDNATDLGKGTPGMSKGHATSLSSNKLSQLVTPQLNKPKAVSGDDDLPKRDDIGERRRKHELRVLAGAGIQSEDDVEYGRGTLGSDGDNVMEEGGESESGDELYREVKKQRASKLAAKAEKYPRTSAIPSMLEEPLVDGKRHISYQMEKNRGLTRHRKKLTKNPRKKYQLAHKKWQVRRKGQVRDMRKPSGPYGGEASGINANISRSRRF